MRSAEPARAPAHGVIVNVDTVLHGARHPMSDPQPHGPGQWGVRSFVFRQNAWRCASARARSYRRFTRGEAECSVLPGIGAECEGQGAQLVVRPHSPGRVFGHSDLRARDQDDGFSGPSIRSRVATRYAFAAECSLPAGLPSARRGLLRATLTVLAGVPQAGQVLAIGETPITVGRAAHADLVIDDPGVSEQHVRVSPVPGGGFSVLDLGSTSGTSLGAKRVAVALLRDGDVLRLGPRAKLRFAIVDPVEGGQEAQSRL